MLLYYKDEIIHKLENEFPSTDKNLVKMILFGSVARNEPSPNSDIDLMLLTTNKKHTRESFSNFRSRILTDYGVLINALYSSEKEFRSGIEPIHSIIKDEGEILWKKKKT